MMHLSMILMSMVTIMTLNLAICPHMLASLQVLVANLYSTIPLIYVVLFQLCRFDLGDLDDLDALVALVAPDVLVVLVALVWLVVAVVAVAFCLNCSTHCCVQSKPKYPNQLHAIVFPEIVDLDSYQANSVIEQPHD